MSYCYCPNCNEQQSYAIHERQGVKAAAAFASGISKAAGFVADQVQYEEDKQKNLRFIADRKLEQNKNNTQNYANTSSQIATHLAGGSHEARCTACNNVIFFPDAQNLDEYRAYGHYSSIKGLQKPFAVLGFFLGAGVAMLFGSTGGASYSLTCIGFAVAGYHAPKYLSPKMINIISRR